MPGPDFSETVQRLSRSNLSSIGKIKMTERMFRMLERYQKLDALLARARQEPFADPVEIDRLRQRKMRHRSRLARLLSPPAANAISL